MATVMDQFQSCVKSKYDDLTDPVVHPQVRQSVCQQNSPASHALRSQVQRTHGNEKTKVAQRNERCFRRSEDMGSGVQVALLVRRRFGAVALGQTLHTRTSIHQDVRRPAKHLVEDEGSNGDNRGVGSCVVHDLLQNCGVSLGLRLAVRYEDGVFLHVVVVAVMTCMAEFPAEERNHQHAVQEPASYSVDGEVSREGVVAAVMGEDPETSEKTTLDEAVKGP